MWWPFKRKKKTNPALDDSFNRVVKEINNIDESDNPKKIQRYILDSCEHIIATAKEIEASWVKFNRLSTQLEDANKLVDIDEDTRNTIAELNNNIIKLTKKKQDYKESERPLDDESFFLMQEHEDSVVEDIHRMEDNERYLDAVEKNIHNLEAEKSRWEIEKDDSKILLGRLRIVNIVLLFIIIAIACTFIILPTEVVSNYRLAIIIALFITVAISFGIFMLISKKRSVYRIAIKKLNQSIYMLNLERMRYVNIKKALQYELDIYGVLSAAELTLIWEKYMLMVREQERYRKNNLDLNYYIDKLYRLFSSLELNYERRWFEQLATIISPIKMQEVKQKIFENRSMVKDQIDSDMELIKTEREEINRLMKEYDFYVPEVMEIISSVDKFCANLRIK